MLDFEKLYIDNREFVYKFLYKLCRSESTAEELTQETFFRAYMNISSLRHEEAVSVWLCQIAKNTYFAWYNEEKRLRSFDETINAEAVDTSADTESTVIKNELSSIASYCLSRLDEPYRTVFTLAALWELPLSEISRRYGKSESWARVTFYRAKQKLISMMEEST